MAQFFHFLGVVFVSSIYGLKIQAKMAHIIQISDMDPDWLYQDPDWLYLEPDP